MFCIEFLRFPYFFSLFYDSRLLIVKWGFDSDKEKGCLDFGSEDFRFSLL